MLKVTVSGSFHRHIDEIMTVVRDLTDRGVKVLSPEDPRIVDADGPFLFVASDRHRSVRLVQDRHLAAVCESDFLWLVTPDGYVGQSASLELGFAIARGVPIFAAHLPPDLTLRQYIRKVRSVDDALTIAAQLPQVATHEPTLLVSPREVLTDVHTRLEHVDHALTSPSAASQDLEKAVIGEVEYVRDLLLLPGDAS